MYRLWILHTLVGLVVAEGVQHMDGSRVGHVLRQRHVAATRPGPGMTGFRVAIAVALDADRAPEVLAVAVVAGRAQLTRGACAHARGKQK
jgi:hypothetical protein